ncbi:MAG: alpha/beta fold hydrolase [Candidatus Omnitrophica bacterium]|nr:alpha/beta fold hydrolase [Candidatus Omnitrophota bacterium]
MTKFRYIDRGRSEVAVLLSGWATDYRVYSGLNLDYNYLVPENISLCDFFDVLYDAIQNYEVCLVGWSFGGVLAADFLVKFPEKIKKAVFCAVKEKYNQSLIDQTILMIKRNKNAYLKSFYRECLKGHTDDEKQSLSRELIDEYIAKSNEDDLVSKLEYLKNNPLNIEKLKEHEHKITFLYGDKDQVVLLEDSLKLRTHFSDDCFCEVVNTGHLTFLCPALKYLI